MSGPKVVRIVTRDERVALCKGHLARLDQQIAHWVEAGKKTGELADTEIAAAQDRRNQLEALLAHDDFATIERQVAQEIAFLGADLGRREQAAIDKAAHQRRRQRQTRENAAALLDALRGKNIDVPAELLGELQSLAEGRALAQADALLSRGFNLLAVGTNAQLTDQQKALAARLHDGNAQVSFVEWKQRHAPPGQNAALLERVDRQIAEAGAVLAADAAAAFGQRLERLEGIGNAAQQHLLLDSLILDLATSIRSAREMRAARRELEQLATELQALAGEDAHAMRARSGARDATASAAALNALIAECREALAGYLQRLAAQARRDAVLQGFARLGYEVRDGMATAWAEDGRVVLKKPSMADYGVEVAGQAETSRMQVRAVALSAQRDQGRDRDIETIWCNEFSRLQQIIGEAGGDLLIEKATGVGQVPLKYVEQVPRTEDSARLHGRGA